MAKNVERNHRSVGARVLDQAPKSDAAVLDGPRRSATTQRLKQRSALILRRGGLVLIVLVLLLLGQNSDRPRPGGTASAPAPASASADTIGTPSLRQLHWAKGYAKGAVAERVGIHVCQVIHVPPDEQEGVIQGWGDSQRSRTSLFRSTSEPARYADFSRSATVRYEPPAPIARSPRYRPSSTGKTA
jgi:hypothetical protein